MIEQIKNLPDISFIGDIELTDVEQQMITDYKNRYAELNDGEEVSLERGEPISLVLYACAVQLYQMYLYIDKAGKENLLKYAEGEALDHIAASRGISRNPATYATVTMKFTLAAAQPGVTAIPKGTRVTNGSVYFATTSYAEIRAGEIETTVECAALEAGEGSNDIAPGAINVLVDPIPYMQSVTNVSESAGGADTESDDALKDRIYVAPSRYSTAGTESSYKYWIQTFNQNITDALVTSKEPGEVDVAFLIGGDIPEDTTVKALQTFLENPEIKPLSDKIVVTAPEVTTYDLNIKYFINKSDAAKVESIQAAVESAVNDYITWQRAKIGRDINPSELTRRVIVAGAKRLEIAAPAFTKVSATGVAVVGTKTVTYGGLEDD